MTTNTMASFLKEAMTTAKAQKVKVVKTTVSKDDTQAEAIRQFLLGMAKANPKGVLIADYLKQAIELGLIKSNKTLMAIVKGDTHRQTAKGKRFLGSESVITAPLRRQLIVGVGGEKLTADRKATGKTPALKGDTADLRDVVEIFVGEHEEVEGVAVRLNSTYNEADKVTAWKLAGKRKSGNYREA